ncbi:MAG: 3-dehydroquinate synthase [Acutalibacteraceae bacterium]|jgi:3-dehydroquinate synthase
MLIPVKTSSGEYNIVLQRGALSNLSNFINLNRKVLVVTDSGVPAEYIKTVASQCKDAVVVSVEAGEGSKSLDCYRLLLSKMVEHEFTRTDCVAAVGGGVVGDLAGFVAACFMRGVDFYNIPTTVLSQVDSSIGGKVAVNFEGYKNIVGAFYPPKAVIIDPETLKTLPQRHISNGLAESVKMSLTSDPMLFSIFESDDIMGNIDTIIERSLLIKKRVVEEDEKESGLRKILNFGHTMAHAIESQNKMQNLYHGECVALGMIPMCSSKVRRRLIPVLEKLQLPTEFKYDAETILNAVKHDKKAAGDQITVIYVPKIGQFEMRDIALSKFLEELKEVIAV